MLFLLILPSAVSALTVDSWHSVADLSDNLVQETIDFRFEANETRAVVLKLPPRLSHVQILLDDKLFSCALKEKIGVTDLGCELPEGKHFMEIEYTTTYPLITLKDKLLFKAVAHPPAKPIEFFYEIKLPLGFVIPHDKDESLFVNPKPSFTYSDGQRIILVWKKPNLEEPFEASVLSEPLSKPMPLLWPVVLALFIIISLIVYIFHLRRRPKEAVVPELIDAEQVIVDLLKEAKNNQLWQKQIQITGKLSKARLSRVLRNLEQRRVIKKEPSGNTNKIRLVTKKKEPESES